MGFKGSKVQILSSRPEKQKTPRDLRKRRSLFCFQLRQKGAAVRFFRSKRPRIFPWPFCVSGTVVVAAGVTGTCPVRGALLLVRQDTGRSTAFLRGRFLRDSRSADLPVPGVLLPARTASAIVCPPCVSELSGYAMWFPLPASCCRPLCRQQSASTADLQERSSAMECRVWRNDREPRVQMSCLGRSPVFEKKRMFFIDTTALFVYQFLRVGM